MTAVLLINLVIFIFASFFLVKSAQFAVKSLGKLACFFGYSEFTIGFILMATATSVPELFVGISSALQKAPTLSLGNIIGSNIINLTLVAGFVAFSLKGIEFQGKIQREEVFYMLFIGLMPLLMLADGLLSRLEGGVLLLIYLIYMINIISKRKVFRKQMKNKYKKVEISKSFLIFFFSFLGLIISANLLASSAIFLATRFSIPLVLVGILAVSLSTSLPELAFEYHAVKTSHQGMALGDLLGSVISNSTLVLGITAILYPISVLERKIFFRNALFLSFVLFIFTIFSLRGKGLSRKEGAFILGLYIAFVILNLFYKI